MSDNYKKIANIVSEVDVKCNVEINTDTINFLSYDDCINEVLPTLYIGYAKVKKIYPEINILDKKINENKLWCFSKEEKLLGFYSLLRKFENLYPQLYFNNYTTVYVNPYFNQHTFKSVISNNTFEKMYINDDSLYLLTDKNIIYSFDLKLYDFVFDNYTSKVCKYLQKNYSKLLIEDFNKKILNDIITFYPNYKDIIEKYIVAIYV